MSFYLRCSKLLKMPLNVLKCPIIAVLPPMDSTPWHADRRGCLLHCRWFGQQQQGQQWWYWGQQIWQHQLCERLGWLAGQGLDCEVRKWMIPERIIHLTEPTYELNVGPPQIGRRLNVENAFGRSCSSFPILSHTGSGEIKGFLKDGQSGLLRPTFYAVCGWQVDSKYSTQPHIHICINHWHLHASCKHGNTLLHTKLSTMAGEG